MHLQTSSCLNNHEDILIKLANINKSYKDKNYEQQILKDISIQIRRGEFVSIVGPSGCGKSTLFNIITGLTEKDSGTISISEDIGYMQQKDLLLPWKTIIDNVTLPLLLRGMKKNKAREEAYRYIEVMGLKGYENKYPYELSGGMKQRASFLRTFLCSQQIMLLDEPFAALDAITKGKMQKWLLEMKNALNNTIIFITHDIEEAIFLSDRIYVLSNKPATVKEEIHLDNFPENKMDRLLSEEVLKLKEKIIKLLDD
jgi:ABC-type nitrate/sulfonate/bicarbonate transport system ATPase subunit